MISLRTVVSALVTSALLAHLLRGATPSVVECGKKATALVVLSSNGTAKAYGSAFCVDASGLFVTNEHVIATAPAEVKLVLQPGEADQRIVAAKVIPRQPPGQIAQRAPGDRPAHYPAL